MSRILNFLTDECRDQVWIRWQHKEQSASLWHVEAFTFNEHHTVWTFCRRGFGLRGVLVATDEERIWTHVGRNPPEDGIRVCPRCARTAYPGLPPDRIGHQRGS